MDGLSQPVSGLMDGDDEAHTNVMDERPNFFLERTE